MYFHVCEPDLIRERKARRLKRRRFWAAGINDILTMDQHDKWKRFGLALHNALDPFAGRLQWMKVWTTNSNPKLILSYYLEFIEKKNDNCKFFSILYLIHVIDATLQKICLLLLKVI